MSRLQQHFELLSVEPCYQLIVLDALVEIAKKLHDPIILERNAKNQINESTISKCSFSNIVKRRLRKKSFFFILPSN